jgi:hypothetical protein
MHLHRKLRLSSLLDGMHKLLLGLPDVMLGPVLFRGLTYTGPFFTSTTCCLCFLFLAGAPPGLCWPLARGAAAVPLAAAMLPDLRWEALPLSIASTS